MKPGSALFNCNLDFKAIDSRQHPTSTPDIMVTVL